MNLIQFHIISLSIVYEIETQTFHIINKVVPDVSSNIYILHVKLQLFFKIFCKIAFNYLSFS
jgi:hypothetical protein